MGDELEKGSTGSPRRRGSGRGGPATTVLGLCPAADEPVLGRILNRREAVFTDVRDFERAMRRGACSTIVVVLPILLEPPGIDWLRRLRRRHMLRTLILVTRREPENTAQFTGLSIDRLVWYQG